MNDNHTPITAARNANTRALKTLKELLARLWHFESVGLGNCQAAQRTRRELNEQLLIQSAALANANFNTNELRDWHGRWTTNATGAATNRSSQTNKPPPTKSPANKPPANPTNKPPTKPAEPPPIPSDPIAPSGVYRPALYQFARDIMDQFQAWRQRNKCCDLDAGTLVSQWMYESGWGQSTVAKGKNLGGMKGKGPAGSTGHFRKYHSFSEFYRDYTNMICNSPRFKEAIGKKGQEYLDILKQAGYDTTDPHYVKNVLQIYKELGFK